MPAIAELCSFLAAPKDLVLTTGWTNKTRGDWLRIRCPLKVNGSTSDQISFVAQCPAEKPGEQVSLALLVEWRGKPRPFARVDWNGSRHGNMHRICKELMFKDAGRTHFHDPRLHQHIGMEELFGGNWDLPIATSLPKNPENFAKLLEEASRLLHIDNLNEIPEPPWSPRASFL